ncbi:MAG: SDR family oxidoreductase [Cyclobacteriaceae bacterium]|nr:SDR family oxidoreductase [Cyclobacteriaceae bacterium]
MMLINLNDKNILVTGGAGDGLGPGICEAVNDAGGRVIVNDLNLEAAQEAASKYKGGLAVAGDVSIAEDVARMFEEIKNQCGNIQGVVNNAGIGLGKYAIEAEEAEFSHLYDVDVKGIWLVTRAFVRQLLDNNEAGSIINISSVQSFNTMHRMAIYASAKSAVNGLTRGLAVELGQYNIRCNAVAPGYIYSKQSLSIIGKWAPDPEKWIEDHKTDHQCLDFFTSARDCGNVVAFLLSDLSRSITGQTIYVDNGTTNLLYNNRYTQ